MILIDEPRWPAHGTLWGHVVSDASLDELHAFARRAELPERSFDHDHYDYPAHRREHLRRSGATLVPQTELVRRLVAAGLRVRPAHRTPHRPRALAAARASWATLTASPPGQALGDDLRDDLLTRWSEPHRRYHDVRHLSSCLSALDDLGGGDPVVTWALWFHDAVWTGTAGADEEASARLAEQRLTGRLASDEVAEVARLVRLTATHDPAPGDRRGALVVDADLAILGAMPGRYHVYARDVRSEYAHLDDATFADGRRRVLQHLLALDPLFRTPRGAFLWHAAARTNLSAELDRLAL